MKKIKITFQTIISITFIVSFYGCVKDYQTETEIGRIESSYLLYLGDDYVEVELRNSELVDKGICYSDKISMPTLNDEVIYITDWSYDETYMVKLENVKEGITYFYRAFIQKEDVVIYGDVQSFTMEKTPAGWVQKPNFPGEPRREAIGFSIGNKGYMGLGSGGGNDFWEYHPALNRWTQKTNGPGNIVVGFSIGNKGYIYTGSQLKNFWEYDPATNRWTPKANFTGDARSGAVGFTIENKGYVGTGYNKSTKDYKKDFWEYDPAANIWTRKADFAGDARTDAVGFAIGNKGYMGTGYGSPLSGYKKDFWEYDPVTNIWTRKADFAGEIRIKPVGFSIENKGYMGIGYSSHFWEYEPVSNVWTRKEDFAGGERGYAAGFVVGNKGYIGTGYVYPHFWEYTPQ
jgi:N-acetylneuraminic acid mutarotase